MASGDDISLLCIPCGRMKIDGARASADPRKGTLELYQKLSDEPGRLWLSWSPVDGAPELRLGFAASDMQFKHLARVKGRVYCCLLSSTNVKHLFWMQCSDPSSDAELCSAFNELLDCSKVNDEQSAPAAAAQPAPTAAAPAAAGGNLQQALSQAFASAFGSIGQSSSSSSSSLQSALASAMATGLQSLGELGAAPSQQLAVDPRLGPTLAQLLDPTHLVPLFQDVGFVERLLPFLPAELRTLEELEFTLSSPQFQAALGQFDLALRTGSLRTVFAQLGLRMEDAAGNTVIKLFISALLAQAARQRQAAS